MIQPFWRYISTSSSRCPSLLIPAWIRRDTWIYCLKIVPSASKFPRWPWLLSAPLPDVPVVSVGGSECGLAVAALSMETRLEAVPRLLLLLPHHRPRLQARSSHCIRWFWWVSDNYSQELLFLGTAAKVWKTHTVVQVTLRISKKGAWCL